MHVPFKVLPIFASLLLLGAFAVVEASSPAMPRAAHAPHNALRQISRAEVAARQAHPELFRKRDDGSPSNPVEPPICNFVLPNRKREVVEQVLTAREMAAFLMGRGTFTSSNGTSYTDEVYAEKLRETANSHPGYYHRVYNVVKDTLGNKLLEVSIPHYKKWKSTLIEGELIYLSPMTAIRSQDVDELERILVADEIFTDIQVHGFRISRKFFEIATSF